MSKTSPEQKQPIQIIIPKEEVDRRIAEMGAALAKEHKDIDPIYVCLLHGGMSFSARLMEAAAQADPSFHPKLTTMIISRYGVNREPGPLRIVAPIPADVLETLPGKDVFFIDDLIDRGGTMLFAREYALGHGAATASGIVLVRKEQHPPVDVPIESRHIGFDNLPPKWLLGMGMNGPEETYRWANFVAIDLQSPEED